MHLREKRLLDALAKSEQAFGLLRKRDIREPWICVEDDHAADKVAEFITRALANRFTHHNVKVMVIPMGVGDDPAKPETITSTYMLRTTWTRREAGPEKRWRVYWQRHAHQHGLPLDGLDKVIKLGPNRFKIVGMDQGRRLPNRVAVMMQSEEPEPKMFWAHPELVRVALRQESYESPDA